LEEEDIEPEDAPLAAFVIDGECPKCGKVLSRGHAKHLASCQGSQVKSGITLADLIKLEVERLEKMEHKLSELEVGGLIDLDEDKAAFMVVGSTGICSLVCSCYHNNWSQFEMDCLRLAHPLFGADLDRL
jgi:hypothetical protein